MEPHDAHNPRDTDSERGINHQDLERIANPLTILHGYTELLQRRLHRGQEIDDAELLRVLNLIETSSRQVREGLFTLLEKLRNGDVDSGPE